jgi:cation:H+ antiporter
MRSVLILLVGVALAGAGGEAFLRGAVGVAERLRIRPAVIAVTFAAFANSTPELLVSATAAAGGDSQLALGNALGSSVVNIGVVVGVTLLFGRVKLERGSAARDLPMAFAAPLLLGLLAVDGEISRLDAGILLVTFFTWLALTVRHTARNRPDADPDGDPPPSPLAATGWTLVGLVMLFFAADLVVGAAEVIGPAIGLDGFVTGATLVAVATSTPEMATALIARMRDHEGVGLSAAVGSNIFNGLWVIGVAAMIRPIPVAWSEIGLSLAAGVATISIANPWGRRHLGPARGVALLCVYVAYVVLLVTIRPD